MERRREFGTAEGPLFGALPRLPRRSAARSARFRHILHQKGGERHGEFSFRGQPADSQGADRQRRGGKPKSKTLSWRGIDPEASADDVDAVANALAGLCLYPRLEVQKQDTDLVTA